MEKLRDSSDNKFNFIKSHQGRFESFLKEDEEQIQRKKISLDERKKIFQELKEKELAEKRLKEEQELVLKLERERIAREEMEEAQKIADNWRKTNQEIAEIMVNKKDSRKNKRVKILSENHLIHKELLFFFLLIKPKLFKRKRKTERKVKSSMKRKILK